MKLKTLKDFKNTEYSDYYCEQMVSEEELKAEAIKWVKSDEYFENPDSWIKHFFNITEDDLK